MITGLKPKRLLYRDGTAQAQRLMEALDTSYVNIEERSISDLLQFAQLYSKSLGFFNENNEPSGNWEAFLVEDGELYNNSTPDEKKIQRKNWINDILSYIDNPEKFNGDDEKLRRLSKPHLILFISFLQLLSNIKDQLNGFTKKHLDFYYLQVLGLSKKKPVPDVVNVIAELSKEIDEFFIGRETLLFAGKDNLGKDLFYKTDKDNVVSQAKVQSIKTLFVEKKITGIKAAREDNKDDADKGLTKMMQLALGDPNPGDNLPAYKGAAVDYSKFKAIYNEAILTINTKTDAYTFITEKLFLKVKETDDCKAIITTGDNAKASESDWDNVYTILDKAWKEKVKWNRQQILKQKREAENDKGKGLMSMLLFAVGDPNSGDDLPTYQGKPVDLTVLIAINDVLHKAGNQPDDLANKADAEKYVTEELLLSADDLANIIKTWQNTDVNTNWNDVYVAVETAQRKKRNFQFPVALKEEWLNIYAISDAKASSNIVSADGTTGSERFNTFGKGTSSAELANAKAANIGFAVSSPQLELTEGLRKITLTIAFKKDKPVPVDEIKKIIPDLPGAAQPFLFFLSNSKDWINVNANTILYGNFIGGKAGEEVKNATVTNPGNTLTALSDFDVNDVGKYIISTDGTIYPIAIQIKKGAVISPAGKVENKPAALQKYTAADIYFNAMQVQLQLDENDPPVSVPGAINQYVGIQSTAPVIAMLLNQVAVSQDGHTVLENGQEKYISLYQQFKDLQLAKVKVQVAVSNIKAVALENDSAILDYKKPVEPFGFRPETGNSLYFAHPEISNKQLDDLFLSFQWLKPPADFKSYYGNYSKLDQYALTITQYIIPGNDAFKADLKFTDNNSQILLGSVSLFDKVNAQTANPVSINIAKSIHDSRPSYIYSRSDVPAEGEDVVSRRRYFSLELSDPDFQHSAYQTLLTKQAFITADPTKQTGDEKDLRKLVLNPPYTPKLKTLTVGYTASFEIDINLGTANEEDSIYHINAFGYDKLEIEKDSSGSNTYFLPYFRNEGELYIGLSNLEVPQNLSILFQMAEGSGDPDLDPPPINWSYLSNNNWNPIEGINIVSDTTNGLLNTGLIEFNIPAGAATGNTLMQEDLHWMRASVTGNTVAISDTVDIFCQGISATFSDNNNSPDHLLAPLPPESIKATLPNIREINKIKQPYTSFKGRPAENDIFFYNRVSERLRHKNRALTMWDYERIILEQFPEIYKAKCVPEKSSGNAGNSGRVNVIVIPDIKGKLPFNPFQPKVPADTIFEIQKYLEQCIPAFASVKVRNPAYLQVKTRFAVEFKQGYNEGFFTKKLDEELKRFLAPWAYDEGADIVLGGNIYSNVIVNFIAERPYVEYVAAMKLFQSKDGIKFTEAPALNRDENVVQAGEPDVILVSALEHEIDMITEEGFKEEDFKGINYMRIELDFKVG